MQSRHNISVTTRTPGVALSQPHLLPSHLHPQLAHSLTNRVFISITSSFQDRGVNGIRQHDTLGIVYLHSASFSGELVPPISEQHPRVWVAPVCLTVNEDGLLHFLITSTS